MSEEVEHDLVPDSASESTKGDEYNRALRRAITPAAAPRVRGLEIAAGTMVEDYGLGDTVWDAFTLADGRTALVCIHVRETPHPPAIALSTLRLVLRAHADAGASLESILARVNDTLIGARAGSWDEAIDVAVIALGSDDGSVEWTGAGFVSGAIIRRAGILDSLPSHGPPIGVMAGFRYGSTLFQLSVGDSILVLSRASDGLFRGAADLVASPGTHFEQPALPGDGPVVYPYCRTARAPAVWGL